MPWARRRLGADVAALSALLLLGALSALTFQQSRIYESRETLWRDTNAKNPASWMAHTNQGRFLLEEGRYREAVVAYRGALAVRPETYRAHVGMARVGLRLGDTDAAFVHLEAALAIEPDAYSARGMIAAIYASRAERPGRSPSIGR